MPRRSMKSYQAKVAWEAGMIDAGLYTKVFTCILPVLINLKNRYCYPHLRDKKITAYVTCPKSMEKPSFKYFMNIKPVCFPHYWVNSLQKNPHSSARIVCSYISQETLNAACVYYKDSTHMLCCCKLLRRKPLEENKELLLWTPISNWLIFADGRKNKCGQCMPPSIYKISNRPTWLTV